MLNCSKKYIISIWEFMENYYNIIYKGKYKLTHRELEFYLVDELKLVLKRVNFNKVSSEKILTGEIILVKDEVGKVVPYFNPYRLCLNMKKISDVTYCNDNLDVSDNDPKKIGELDYERYLLKKSGILSRKKRKTRRNY